MDVTRDTRGRPHAHCYPCGVQVMVRGRRGVVLFLQKYGAIEAPTPKEPTR